MDINKLAAYLIHHSLSIPLRMKIVLKDSTTLPLQSLVILGVAMFSVGKRKIRHQKDVVINRQLQ